VNPLRFMAARIKLSRNELFLAVDKVFFCFTPEKKEIGDNNKVQQALRKLPTGNSSRSQPPLLLRAYLIYRLSLYEVII
jgi:hypothetical protein